MVLAKVITNDYYYLEQSKKEISVDEATTTTGI